MDEFIFSYEDFIFSYHDFVVSYDDFGSLVHICGTTLARI